MKSALIQVLTIGVLVCIVQISDAQTKKVVQGVIFEKGKNIRIINATVYNKTTDFSVSTDKLGLFSMLVSPKDTLLISHEGYIDQTLIPGDLHEIRIYLQPSNMLKEVVIKSESYKENLKELEDGFRKKGIYYNGRPPLYLLSPFGGSPLTFFHELLSKDGRQARRSHQYVVSQSDQYEISRRFNDYTIKSIIPIEAEQLEEFNSAYRPILFQLNSWTDFDLYNYIKKSYQEFLKGK